MIYRSTRLCADSDCPTCCAIESTTHRAASGAADSSARRPEPRQDQQTRPVRRPSRAAYLTPPHSRQVGSSHQASACAAMTSESTPSRRTWRRRTASRSLSANAAPATACATGVGSARRRCRSMPRGCRCAAIPAAPKMSSGASVDRARGVRSEVDTAEAYRSLHDL